MYMEDLDLCYRFAAGGLGHLVRARRDGRPRQGRHERQAPHAAAELRVPLRHVSLLPQALRATASARSSTPPSTRDRREARALDRAKRRSAARAVRGVELPAPRVQIGPDTSLTARPYTAAASPRRRLSHGSDRPHRAAPRRHRRRPRRRRDGRSAVRGDERPTAQDRRDGPDADGRRRPRDRDGPDPGRRERRRSASTSTGARSHRDPRVRRASTRRTRRIPATASPRSTRR